MSTLSLYASLSNTQVHAHDPCSISLRHAFTRRVVLLSTGFAHCSIQYAAYDGIQTCKHNSFSVRVIIHLSILWSGFYLPLYFEMSHDSVLPPRYLSLSEDEFEIVMLTPAQMDLCVLMKLDFERRRGMFSAVFWECCCSVHVHRGVHDIFCQQEIELQRSVLRDSTHTHTCTV